MDSIVSIVEKYIIPNEAVIFGVIGMVFVALLVLTSYLSRSGRSIKPVLITTIVFWAVCVVFLVLLIIQGAFGTKEIFLGVI